MSEGRTARQREVFCKAFAGMIFEGRTRRNGTQSAIVAGYSEHTAAQQASRLLKNPAIQKRIEELTLMQAERDATTLPGENDPDAWRSDPDSQKFPIGVLVDVALHDKSGTARAMAAKLIGQQQHGMWQDSVKVQFDSFPDSALADTARQLLPPETAEAIVALLVASRGVKGGGAT